MQIYAFVLFGGFGAGLWGIRALQPSHSFKAAYSDASGAARRSARYRGGGSEALGRRSEIGAVPGEGNGEDYGDPASLQRVGESLVDLRGIGTGWIGIQYAGVFTYHTECGEA